MTIELSTRSLSRAQRLSTPFLPMERECMCKPLIFLSSPITGLHLQSLLSHNILNVSYSLGQIHTIISENGKMYKRRKIEPMELP
jgi:hypothetical protein